MREWTSAVIVNASRVVPLGSLIRKCTAGVYSLASTAASPLQPRRRCRSEADGGIDLGEGLARENVDREDGLHGRLRLVDDLGDAEVDGDRRQRERLIGDEVGGVRRRRRVATPGWR
jgi:hypothetical protein